MRQMQTDSRARIYYHPPSNDSVDDEHTVTVFYQNTFKGWLILLLIKVFFVHHLVANKENALMDPSQYTCIYTNKINK